MGHQISVCKLEFSRKSEGPIHKPRKSTKLHEFKNNNKTEK